MATGASKSHIDFGSTGGQHIFYPVTYYEIKDRCHNYEASDIIKRWCTNTLVYLRALPNETEYSQMQYAIGYLDFADAITSWRRIYGETSAPELSDFVIHSFTDRDNLRRLLLDTDIQQKCNWMWPQTGRIMFFSRSLKRGKSPKDLSGPAATLLDDANFIDVGMELCVTISQVLPPSANRCNEKYQSPFEKSIQIYYHFRHPRESGDIHKSFIIDRLRANGVKEMNSISLLSSDNLSCNLAFPTREAANAAYKCIFKRDAKRDDITEYYETRRQRTITLRNLPPGTDEPLIVLTLRRYGFENPSVSRFNKEEAHCDVVLRGHAEVCQAISGLPLRVLGQGVIAEASSDYHTAKLTSKGALIGIGNDHDTVDQWLHANINQITSEVNPKNQQSSPTSLESPQNTEKRNDSIGDDPGETHSQSTISEEEQYESEESNEDQDTDQDECFSCEEKEVIIQDLDADIDKIRKEFNDAKAQWAVKEQEWARTKKNQESTLTNKLNYAHNVQMKVFGGEQKALERKLKGADEEKKKATNKLQHLYDGLKGEHHRTQEQLVKTEADLRKTRADLEGEKKKHSLLVNKHKKLGEVDAAIDAELKAFKERQKAFEIEKTRHFDAKKVWVLEKKRLEADVVEKVQGIARLKAQLQSEDDRIQARVAEVQQQAATEREVALSTLGTELEARHKEKLDKRDCDLAKMHSENEHLRRSIQTLESQQTRHKKEINTKDQKVMEQNSEIHNLRESVQTLGTQQVRYQEEINTRDHRLMEKHTGMEQLRRSVRAWENQQACESETHPNQQHVTNGKSKEPAFNHSPHIAQNPPIWAIYDAKVIAIMQSMSPKLAQDGAAPQLLWDELSACTQDIGNLQRELESEKMMCLSNQLHAQNGLAHVENGIATLIQLSAECERRWAQLNQDPDFWQMYQRARFASGGSSGGNDRRQPNVNRGHAHDTSGEVEPALGPEAEYTEDYRIVPGPREDHYIDVSTARTEGRRRTQSAP